MYAYSLYILEYVLSKCARMHTDLCRYFLEKNLKYYWSMLWHVAVWWSVLQCVAVCCSVLQCVAVCYKVLQCVAITPASGSTWLYSAPHLSMSSNRLLSPCISMCVYIYIYIVRLYNTWHSWKDWSLTCYAWCCFAYVSLHECRQWDRGVKFSHQRIGDERCGCVRELGWQMMWLSRTLWLKVVHGRGEQDGEWWVCVGLWQNSRQKNGVTPKLPSEVAQCL